MKTLRLIENIYAFKHYSFIDENWAEHDCMTLYITSVYL